MDRVVGWLIRDKYRDQNLPKKIRGDLTRLRESEPLAYVIGWVDFLGCKIDLSLKPLIPRPETEYWTEKAIGEMKFGRSQPLRVLDLCAGSGCIGIAVLKHIPNAQVWFADNDINCLEQIHRNLRLNKIKPARDILKHSNILQNVRMSFDYILANPPYIPEKRKLRLPVSVRKFEPPHALFGGLDGLKFIREIVREGKQHLRPGGKIYLEFDSGQAGKIKKLARSAGYGSISIRSDQFGKKRFAIITHGRELL